MAKGYGKGGSKGKPAWEVDHANQQLGGGDAILELDNWTVVTQKARSSKDMRPIRVQKGKGKIKELNKFAVLAESEENINWTGAPEVSDVDAVAESGLGGS